MFPNEYKDFELLAEAALDAWAPGAKVKFSTLHQGYSGAAVLRVDLRKVRQGQVETGQYILKLTKNSEWSSHEKELSAHDMAYKHREEFSRFHIPRIVRSAALSDLGGYAVLYEIAGSSLDAFTSVDGPESAEFRIVCDKIISDSLTNWTSPDPKEDRRPHQLLEDWLGYRISQEATAFHDFVARMMGTELLLPVAGEVLLNPLKFYEYGQSSNWADISVLPALLHGDLHGGNLLVHRLEPLEKPYWVVDFGLSRLGPFGFDQAYLEMAQIVYCMGEQDPTLLINVLKHLDDPTEYPLLPPHTSWLYKCLRAMRAAFQRWRDENHPRRIDEVNRQMQLARVAVGLNWASKHLSERQRYFGLCYAGWAAREYLRLYEPESWDAIGQRNPAAQSVAQGGGPKITETDHALWEELWGAVKGFSPSSSKFILVAEAQRNPESVANLSALGQLPWSAVVDLDPVSDISGLHHYVAPVLQSQRSLHTFDVRLPTIEFGRATAWMMAAGWELKNETPTGLADWRYDKVPLVRAFAHQIAKQTSPEPVQVIVLPGSSLEPERPLVRVNEVLKAIDEVFRGREKIIVLGTRELPELERSIHIPITPELFAKQLANAFGQQARTDVASVPGQQGAWVEIPIQDLRSLQENLEVLHSNILQATSAQREEDRSTFWRGAPPSWSDLSQGVDIPRTIGPDLLKTLRNRLEAGRNFTVVLYHHPGAGATTAAWRVAWDLHTEYPTAILTRWSEALSARLQKLYRIAQRPILLVAESPLLTETQREDLHRDLSQNNTPVILLYQRRGFQNQDEHPLRLQDPMHEKEAEGFLDRYRTLTDDPWKWQELERITRDDALVRYRTPFFYGLITHERDFTAVDRYVGSHIQGVRGKARDLMEYLAIVTIFSNTGLPETLVKLMLGVPESVKLSVADIFGEGPARLISVQQGRMRILHQVLAEEVLSDLVGGGKDDWRFELHHLSIDLIHEVVAVASPDSQMVLELFRQLFIERVGGDGDELDDRRDFSPIIELIDAIDKSLGHRVLTELKDSCPLGSHFWNHLGRHQVYRMRRDYEMAEKYLEEAIRLSPEDYLHYHTLGVVLRSRVRDRIRTAGDTSADSLLNEISDWFGRAGDAFEKSRALNPENLYGYITHVQMILEVAAALKQLLNIQNIGQIRISEAPVQDWVLDNLSSAQKLLSDADQLYGTLNQPETYLTACHADMRRLYGDMDQVIYIWEVANASGSNSPASRRALANAYVARSDNRWSKMQQSELRRIVELMEVNIHSNGRKDEDYRLWFEAYKLLPDFDIDEALAKLRLWVSYFPSWRAFYYMYILHFYLWYTGRSDNKEDMEEALGQCQGRIVGRKSFSAQWFGHFPETCPLVSAEDLGKWDKRIDFWEDSSQLRRLNGMIEDPILGPQAGWILIDGRVRAFFVPVAGGFIPHQDENTPVNFYLGFSPVGLRAWGAKRGHVPGGDRVRVGRVTSALTPNTPPRPDLSDQEKAARVRKLRLTRVLQFIDEVVVTKTRLGAELTLAELEHQIEAAFGIDGVIRELGVKSIQSLVQGSNTYTLAVKDDNTYISSVGDRTGSQPEVQTPINARQGHVVFYNRSRGYGFIDDGSAEQFWFTMSHMLPEYRNQAIIGGQKVEFQPETGSRGPIALRIRLLNDREVETLLDDDLRSAVEARVRQTLSDALILSKEVSLLDLSQQLTKAFPGREPLPKRLGVGTLGYFLKTLPGIQVIGEYPNITVALTDKRTFGRLPEDRSEHPSPGHRLDTADFREQVKAEIRRLLDAAEREDKNVELPQLAQQLQIQFPGEAVNKRLGYARFIEMLRSFTEFAVIQLDGHDILCRPTSMPRLNAAKQPGVTTPSPKRTTPLPKISPSTQPAPETPEDLRAAAKAFIIEQLSAAGQIGKPLELPTLASAVSARFPGEAVHKRLGYRQFSGFLRSFPEFAIASDGGHDVLHVKEATT